MQTWDIFRVELITFDRKIYCILYVLKIFLRETKRGYFLSVIVKSSKKREKISFSDFRPPLSSFLRPSIRRELPLGALKSRLQKYKSFFSRLRSNTCLESPLDSYDAPSFGMLRVKAWTGRFGLFLGRKKQKKTEKYAWKLSVNNTKV